MNRAEVFLQVIRWELVAEIATAKAAEYRTMLNADARAEFEEQGTAPTWRIADVATASLPVSKRKPVVSDSDALLKWVKTRHPSEVVEQIRPTFARALPGLLRCADDVVVDGEGEIVPGMTVAEGGIPGSLRIVPTEEVKALLSLQAADMLAAVDAALNEPGGGDS